MIKSSFFIKITAQFGFWMHHVYIMVLNIWALDFQPVIQSAASNRTDFCLSQEILGLVRWSSKLGYTYAIYM